jgi:hypothetical protein
VTFTQKLTLQLGEWILSDLILQSDIASQYPFCCHESEASSRVAAIASMYVRAIEQAERLGLLPIGKASQVKQWLSTGALKVL